MIVVEPLDPHRASDSELAGFYAVRSASMAVDTPEDDPVTYENVVGRLRTPLPGAGEVRYWLGTRDGEAVALAVAVFPGHENARMALTDVVVHPDHRRRGIGAAVLRAVVPELVACGREVVESLHVVQGSAGEEWALSLGFRVVHAGIVQHLRFADVDRTLWDVPVPEGYRVERWVGAAPEELVASYAVAKGAMHDAPRGGDLEYRDPEWTVDRVRELEAEVRGSGVEERVVVAVHEPTGEVVGLTQLQRHPPRPRHGYQGDTAVLAAHRGHGLGRVVKAHMLRWLDDDGVELDVVDTGTAADNVHMAGVNHSLGYATVRTVMAVNRTVAGLLEALGGVDAQQRQTEHEDP
ncbi:MAG TPA: GNAT family N-acetyltransferase [Umezawaea sp.]|nr:GNAT family N-acetyltransferase [Umezawaea sp.]